MSITGARKSRGRPKVGSTPTNVRLPPEELARLDESAERDQKNPQRLSKAARRTAMIIRRLVELGLKRGRK
jgi:hypothetical protein